MKSYLPVRKNHQNLDYQPKLTSLLQEKTLLTRMTHKALVRESGANYTKFNPRTAPATVIGEPTDH